MKLSQIKPSVSFCAKLNENTRSIIKRLERNSSEKLEQTLDKAIEKSPLKDFGGEETTISIGFYSTSDFWGEVSTVPAPVINTKLNDKEVSVTLPSYGQDVDMNEEEDIIRHLQAKKYAQYDFCNVLTNTKIDKIKTLLAQEYIRQSANEMIDNSTSETFEKIKNGDINF